MEELYFHDPDLTALGRTTQASGILNPGEVRQQLARIVDSTAFRASLRLTRFLSFVVEAAMTGKGQRIKAYTIAVEALGRCGNFDPQNNPIVRVEAVRLRKALARYYAGEGHDDPLLIALPRGSYVPCFRLRGTGERAAVAERDPEV